MNIILQKAVFDDAKLKKYIVNITVTELQSLSEPCHYPDWKKHYHELISLTNLTDDDIKLFTKRFYSETKIQINLDKYDKIPLLMRDVGSNLLIILMHHFLKQRDVKTYSMFMIFFMIRQYGNFLYQNLKYCKPEVFSYTLNHLNPTHLFIREKSISNALFHLATAMKRRYTDGLLEPNPDKISQFIFASRTSIAQSLRSFLESYYKYEKEGKSIQNPLESEEGEEISSKELDRGERIADLVSKKICVFKELDYKALDDARKLTRINTSLSVIIVKELQDIKFINDVKFIIELFLRDMKSVKEICGKDFLSYVKRLMGIKRTTKSIFFKKEVNNLLMKILTNLEYSKKYSKITPQTQFQINSFLAFYITMYTRNIIC